MQSHSHQQVCLPVRRHGDAQNAVVPKPDATEMSPTFEGSRSLDFARDDNIHYRTSLNESPIPIVFWRQL